MPIEQELYPEIFFYFLFFSFGAFGVDAIVKKKQKNQKDRLLEQFHLAPAVESHLK